MVGTKIDFAQPCLIQAIPRLSLWFASAISGDIYAQLL